MADPIVKTLLDLLPPLVSLGVLGLAWKLARQSKRYEDAVIVIERVGPAVEGDPTEHADNAKRHGLMGRTTVMEGITKPLARKLTAVLRGMGVPSDLSDDHKLEAAVKERFRAADVSVDRLAAIEALVPRDSAPSPEPDELPPPHPKTIAKRLQAPWKKEPK